MKRFSTKNIETKTLIVLSAFVLCSSLAYSNPFNVNTKVKGVKTVNIEIKESTIAKAAGIEEIKEGYPLEGKIAENNLRLRSWPWGAVLGKYSKGTSVKVLGESGEFYLVEIDGVQGYMHKSYISTSKEPASMKTPTYPGDTRNGGYMLLEKGIEASNKGAEQLEKGLVASNNNSEQFESGNSSVTPSADDKTTVLAGKAPKKAVDTPSGAPALHYQSAPKGSGINTKSPQFKEWLDSAINTYGDWNMPVIKNKYGQTITVEMFMKAIMWIESGGTHRKSDGTMVGSSVGAQGFMALMPATAKELGVSAQDPKGNIAGGCKLFQKLFSGNYSPAGKATGIDKLMLVACSYNAGPWSKLVKGSWQDLKNTGSSVQSYGIKLKCCLGLELTADEKAYCKSKMAGGRSVEAYANEHYSYSQGLGL